MRRYRPTHYSLAFLTVAIGIAAVPAAASADDGTDPVVPADGATQAPQPAAPSPHRPPRRNRHPRLRRREAPPPETTEPPGGPRAAGDDPRRRGGAGTARDHADDSGRRSRRRSQWTTRRRRSPPRRRRRASRRRRRSSGGPSPRPAMTTSSTPTRPTQLPDIEVVRPIAFPVLGTVHYGNDWGNCRDGCARRHQGTDLIGVRMQPLVAAVDGTVTRIRYENVGTAGSVISITGTDGWYYNYFHVNNDTPGTDDGLAGHEWQISPQLTVGSTVQRRSGDRLHGRQRQRRRLGAAPPLRDPPTRPHAGQPVPQPRRGPGARDLPAHRGRGPDRSDRAVTGRRVGDPDRRPRPLVDRPRRAPVRRRPGGPQRTARRCGLRRNAGAGPDPDAGRDTDAVAAPAPAPSHRPRRRRLHRWCRHRGHGRWSAVSRCGGSPRRHTTSRRPPRPCRWSTSCSTTTATWCSDPDVIEIGMTLRLPHPV